MRLKSAFQRQLSLLPLIVFPLDILADNQAATEDYVALLPSITVETTDENTNTKGYVSYADAQATRNFLLTKEIPQTIDVLNIQKNKNYGTNDLSSILEGNAGVDTSYDMRGENIYLRGFQADANDIYRDGIRESGQIRRSTANIERVEILKGPSSVLYGRSNGGGIINLVSKTANFTTNNRNIGMSYGSWQSRRFSLDINQILNANVAVRLTGEISAANAYRYQVNSKGRMFSPSIQVQRDDKRLIWEGQYTYDSQWRIPDRNPTKKVYDLMGINYRQSFAHQGDYIEDKLQVWRSDLKYFINDQWLFQWQLAYRQATQNFDHYFGGEYEPTTRKLKQSYAWQQTENTTFSNNFILSGDIESGRLQHKLTIGLDYSQEKRHPVLGVLRNQAIDPFDTAEQWRLRPQKRASTNNHHKAYAKGIFLQDLIALRYDLKLMLAGRYEQYRFHSTDINGNRRDHLGYSFSPNFGIVWDITPEQTLYASYSRSFSPYGGRSYLGVSTNQKEIFTSPEYSKQYEIGLKSEWLNKRLVSTISAYQLTHYNIRYRPDATVFNVWAIRKERSKGVEVSLLGQVASKWYIRSSFGWLSAKVKEDQYKPENVNRTLNNTGNFTGNLFVRYTPTEKLYMETGVTHLGKRYFHRNGSNYTVLPSFTRIDAMLGYRFKSWSMTFAVANVLNKPYWRSDAMPGNPRSFNLRVNYTF